MREVITLVPLIVSIFWIGVYPETFLSYMHVTVEHLIEGMNVSIVAGGDNLLTQYVMEIFR